jgi:hypothetical protein
MYYLYSKNIHWRARYTNASPVKGLEVADSTFKVLEVADNTFKDLEVADSKFKVLEVTVSKFKSAGSCR